MTPLVLVVDDEPDVEPLFRQQFRRDIRAGRFVLDFAASAAAALVRVAEVADHPLILVLSDINMPEMTGLELLPRITAMRPDLSVIMVTAYGDADTVGRAAAGGADGLLAKPVDFAALRHEIDSRLAQPIG